MKTSSRTTLIFANALVAIPVLVGRWTPATVLRVFWWELIPLGILGIAWIAGARARGPFQKSRGYQVIFYVAHYSTFCVIYRAALARTVWSELPAPNWFWLWILPIVLVLAVPHVVSFRKDYRQGADRYVSTTRAMVMPYYRAVPLHGVLIVLVLLLPATAVGGLLLVAAKTLTDVLFAAWYLRGLEVGSATEKAWDR